MSVEITQVAARSILTRTSGFLTTVTSHSLQPYRGCTYGRALCGVGCYVQHNGLLTRGQPWGSFLDVKGNAADLYLQHVARERRWARAHRDGFTIFMSSSTDPWVPQERRHRVSRQVLQAMIQEPPDELILQTHSHRLIDDLATLQTLQTRCQLRVHLSIESDQQDLPGLPAPASSLDRRFDAARQLQNAGLRVVITVSPLLPILDEVSFFERIAAHADAVVIDHYIGGDGSPEGRRTAATRLPAAMADVEPASTGLAYRDHIIEVARRHMPGRVGVSIDGFAGRFLAS